MSIHYGTNVILSSGSVGGYVTDEQAEMIKTEDFHKQMVTHVMNVDSHNWSTLPSMEYPISHNLEGKL